MNKAAVLAVVTIVLFAGCVGSSGGRMGTEAGVATTDSPTADVPETTGTPAEVTIEPDTPTEDRESSRGTPADNPWGKKPIVVSIHNQANKDRNFTPQVAQAIEYWHSDGREYAGWEPAFVLRPNSSDPDIVVQFVEEVRNCAWSFDDTLIGCASILYTVDTPTDPELVLIDAHLNNNSTTEIVKHEFGHLLGLQHNDDPENVMNGTLAVGREIKTGEPYKVYLELESSMAGEGHAKRIIQHAFDYYEGGAEGWLKKKPTFEFVESEARADIKIYATQDSPGGSMGYYENSTIQLDGLPYNRYGWHVGYWLGYFFGAQSIEDLPPAFDEPHSDDRYGWWD